MYLSAILTVANADYRAVMQVLSFLGIAHRLIENQPFNIVMFSWSPMGEQSEPNASFLQDVRVSFSKQSVRLDFLCENFMTEGPIVSFANLVKVVAIVSSIATAVYGESWVAISEDATYGRDEDYVRTMAAAFFPIAPTEMLSDAFIRFDDIAIRLKPEDVMFLMPNWDAVS